VEFVRARDVGLADLPDDGVLEYAAGQGFVVVSHDVNTMTASAWGRLTAGRPLSGLLMVRQTSAIGPIIDSLILIWSASEAEEWQGQIGFLPL
jgi:hypothetical protein